MTATEAVGEDQVERFREDYAKLTDALRAAIVGQDQLVDDLVTTVLAGGHALLEGLPGLGKTQLVRALANAFGLPLSRIQCTPDLMPADITGSEILASDSAGESRHLAFRQGPVFSSIVLVDEINRATPKTQAALLEAMQEGQVTYAGTRHVLPRPFWVLATQNPIELEGTYPLPEAQLDRFMTKLEVAYPQRDSLLTLVDRSLDGEPADRVGEILPLERLVEMMALTREVVVATPVKKAAIDLTLGTHPDGHAADNSARAHFRYGASPRALQAMLRLARVRALADGRAHVSRDDVAAVALPVLRHRVLLTIDSELQGLFADPILRRLIEAWTGTT